MKNLLEEYQKKIQFLEDKMLNEKKSKGLKNKIQMLED